VMGGGGVTLQTQSVTPPLSSGLEGAFGPRTELSRPERERVAEGRHSMAKGSVGEPRGGAGRPKRPEAIGALWLGASGDPLILYIIWPLKIPNPPIKRPPPNQ